MSTHRETTTAAMLLLTSVLALTGCSREGAAPQSPAAATTTETSPSRSVEVVGIYEQLNVAQKADAAPHYVGRVVVRQTDGRTIMLETHTRGVRAAEEIAAFEGKLVKVQAAHMADGCLGWGDGTQAAIVGRCLRGIVGISPVSP